MEDPETVSSYAMRHSHITAQLVKGLPVQLVAKLHDTSASQIEKHYAATIASHTDELMRAAMMEVDIGRSRADAGAGLGGVHNVDGDRRSRSCG